jgi:hypothetical protein
MAKDRVCFPNQALETEKLPSLGLWRSRQHDTDKSNGNAVCRNVMGGAKTP